MTLVVSDKDVIIIIRVDRKVGMQETGSCMVKVVLVVENN